MGSMLVRKFIGSGRVVPNTVSASSKSGVSARELGGKTGITEDPSNRDGAEKYFPQHRALNPKL